MAPPHASDDGAVMVSRKTLGRLLGNTKVLNGMDDVAVYPIDQKAVAEAEEVLDR